MIMAHCFAVQLRFIGRPFAEEALFALGAVIEQAAGRFAPEPWWRRD
jgi:aspartyl-tRNA(Asn)/glutamyl-tRNA(Gln) amidotransferase subunit A